MARLAVWSARKSKRLACLLVGLQITRGVPRFCKYLRRSSGVQSSKTMRSESPLHRSSSRRLAAFRPSDTHWSGSPPSFSYRSWASSIPSSTILATSAAMNGGQLAIAGLSGVTSSSICWSPSRVNPSLTTATRKIQRFPWL